VGKTIINHPPDHHFYSCYLSTAVFNFGTFQVGKFLIFNWSPLESYTGIDPHRNGIVCPTMATSQRHIPRLDSPLGPRAIHPGRTWREPRRLLWQARLSTRRNASKETTKKSHWTNRDTALTMKNGGLNMSNHEKWWFNQQKSRFDKHPLRFNQKKIGLPAPEFHVKPNV